MTAWRLFEQHPEPPALHEPSHWWPVAGERWKRKSSGPGRREMRLELEGTIVKLKTGSKRNARRAARGEARRKAEVARKLRLVRSGPPMLYLTKAQFALVAGDAKWSQVAGGFLFEGDVLVTHCRVGRFSYRARGLAS